MVKVPSSLPKVAVAHFPELKWVAMYFPISASTASLYFLTFWGIETVSPDAVNVFRLWLKVTTLPVAGSTKLFSSLFPTAAGRTCGKQDW